MLIATSTLGLEGAVARELKELGYAIKDASNGKIFFEASIKDIPFLNIHLRTPERLLLFLGSFVATSYDELYENIRNLDFSPLPKQSKVWIAKVRCVDSKLFSERAVQSVAMKAFVDSLKTVDGSQLCPIHVYLRKNRAIIALDMTGKYGLHMRGYRKKYSKAPLRETIAAALLILSRYEKEGCLHDPFCGSGTIAIEAAMIASNIPPGLNRDFSSQTWKILMDLYEKERERAKAAIKTKKVKIFCSDIDEKILKVARENARRAGVFFDIFREDFRRVKPSCETGKIVTNPPYGKRMESIWKHFPKLFETFASWEVHSITPYSNLKSPFHKKIKSTPFFNSGVKVFFNQFLPKTFSR